MLKKKKQLTMESKRSILLKENRELKRDIKKLLMENEMKDGKLNIIVNTAMKDGSEYHAVFYTFDNKDWTMIPVKYGYGDAYVTTIKDYFNENNVMNIDDDVYTKADLENVFKNNNMKYEIVDAFDTKYENLTDNYFDLDLEKITELVNSLTGFEFDYDKNKESIIMDAGDIKIIIKIDKATDIWFGNSVKIDILEDGELTLRDTFGTDEEKHASEIIAYIIEKHFTK